MRILLGIIIGLLLGWIFPVEGPIDYVYDDYASQPAHKHPVAAPAQKSVPEVDPAIIEEMDEEWREQMGLE